MPDITLPELHKGQIDAIMMPGRFKAIRCGRRWGKTMTGATLACDMAPKGKSVGIFAPDYRILSETYEEISDILDPVTVGSNKVEGVIRTLNKGRVDFWTLNNPRAGRSRKYDLVILDEVAFAGDDMQDIWLKAIKPTLVDKRGGAIALSTPNGSNEENFFHQICTDKSLGWSEFHAPTWTNPFLPSEEIEKLKTDYPPLVFQQEFAAEFVDWNGVAFFPLDSMLDGNGKPLPYPERTGQIYAVIDTALKDGKEHDGTAVVYFAREKFFQPRLIILDWDIIQVEGALLEDWLPSVYSRMTELSDMCRSREGVLGAFIEDKASGIVLLQQAKKRNLRAFALPSEMTALGKEGRALSVSGYFHRGEIKMSQYAFDKVVRFKGVQKNHLISQLCGFRMGDTDNKRADDLADCAMYAASIGCGNSKGY